MRRTTRLLLGITFAALLLPGCSDDPARPGASITVTPTADTLDIGATLQFNANLTGIGNPAVIWEVVEGSSHGSVTSLGLYTAPPSLPSPATVTVKATSQAEPSVSGTASLRLREPPGVYLSPGPAPIEAGTSLQLNARVVGATDQAVVWTTTQEPAWGSITADGLYAAPSTVPSPPTVRLRATSVENPSLTREALLTLWDDTPLSTPFVQFAAGSFAMGDGESYCAFVDHPVTLTESFSLAATEVTRRQYLNALNWAYAQGHVVLAGDEVIDPLDSGYSVLLDLKIPSTQVRFIGSGFELRDEERGLGLDHPIILDRWAAAAAYCDWENMREGRPREYDHQSWVCNGGDPYRARGYRLPTEAEWEYAAQYADERLYPWGNEPPSNARANYGGAVGWTTPVMSFPPEKVIGGVGLYDMAGNVWEWCGDWFLCNPPPDEMDPPGPGTGVDRVVRGGDWRGFAAYLKCAARSSWNNPHIDVTSVGVRVARTVDPGP